MAEKYEMGAHLGHDEPYTNSQSYGIYSLQAKRKYNTVYFATLLKHHRKSFPSSSYTSCSRNVCEMAARFVFFAALPLPQHSM